MRARLRFVLCCGALVAAATACNAILGITDLQDPGPADSGRDVDSSMMGSDTFVPVQDGAVDALPPCSNAGDSDTCFIIEPNTDGGIFPTWPITSDESIQESTGVSLPIYPDYDAGEAGPGEVVESHSMLTWKTGYRDGGGDDTFDFAAARAACEKFGTGWRLPTRIELASTQYRAPVPPTKSTREVCIPNRFDHNEFVFAWTTTRVPVPLGGPDDVYLEEETLCGFVAAGKTTKQWARCVKGDTKPATFVITKSKDTVTALDTGLVWERTGALVKSYAEARAHCDAQGTRIPVIQELYSIIDTRTLALFRDGMFVSPVTDAGTPSSILSQTAYAIDPDGGAPLAYEVVSLKSSPGEETAVGATSPLPDVLVRCVTPYGR